MRLNKIILSMVCLTIIYTSGCAKTNIATNQEYVINNIDNNNKLNDNKFDTYRQDGVLPADFVVDENLALDIGNAVIRSVYNEYVLKQTEVFAYEIEEEDVFIVSRIPKDEETLGGDYNVAISKKNGTILKIWAGE